MVRFFGPMEFLLICLAGWLNQRERLINEYLRAENRILRAQLGNKRLRLTDRKLIYTLEFDDRG